MILNIHYCVENFAFLRLGGMELLYIVTYFLPK